MTYTGQQHYATNGKANAALTTGIIGTAGVALAALGGNNNCNNGGLFGNLFGGNNGHCYVTKEENALSTALAIAQSEKESLATSKNDMERLFQELRAQDAKIADGLIQTGNAVGILNADVACLKESVARNREEGFRNLQESKTYTDTRVNAEENIRKCEDEKVVLWAKGELATKVNSVNKIDIADLCGKSPLANDCCY